MAVHGVSDVRVTTAIANAYCVMQRSRPDSVARVWLGFRTYLMRGPDDIPAGSDMSKHRRGRKARARAQHKQKC